jgi:hypothetical protein
VLNVLVGESCHMDAHVFSFLVFMLNSPPHARWVGNVNVEVQSPADRTESPEMGA